MNNDLSIVIIGRNEENAIADCISAAQVATSQLGGAEIIFVDSASTDRTADIAAAMGARVIGLDTEHRLCPSAGRYVGSQHAAGEFILFLDTDTLIYKDFLFPAIEHLRSHPRVAGVNGRIDDLNEEGELLSDVEERYDDITETKWLRGPACFYRRSALMAVGSFDPDVAMEEEAELGLRLIKAGWSLQLLPIPMACHTRCYHCQSFRSLVSTFKRDLVTGRLGEITRTMQKAARSGNLLAFCWLRLKTTMLATSWLIGLALFALMPGTQALISLTTVVLASLLIIYLKKKSLNQTLLFLPNKLFCLIDVLAGIPKLGRRR